MLTLLTPKPLLWHTSPLVSKRLRQEKEFDLQVKIEDLKIKLANLKQTKEKVCLLTIFSILQ